MLPHKGRRKLAKPRFRPANPVETDDDLRVTQQRMKEPMIPLEEYLAKRGYEIVVENQRTRIRRKRAR